MFGMTGIVALLACMFCLAAKYYLTSQAVHLRARIERERDTGKEARREVHLLAGKLKVADAQARTLERKTSVVRKSLHELQKAYGDFLKRDYDDERVKVQQEELLRQINEEGAER